MNKKKATLRSQWWLAYYRSIQFCYQCGEKLARRYVLEEKKKRHVCQECRQITYLNPKVVAGLIPVTATGGVVLLKRSQEPALGRWTYPSGYQEIGETVEEAAVREAGEEIMVKPKLKKLLGIYSYPDAGVVTIVYVGHVTPGQKPKVGEEAQEVRTFRPTEIPWGKLAFRSTRDALRDWKNTKLTRS